MVFEIALVVGLGVIAFVLVYIASSFNKDTPMLKMLFLFFSMFTILVGFYSIGQIVTNANIQATVYTLYTVTLYIILFMMFYFVVNILRDVLGWYVHKRKKDRGEIFE